MTPEEFFELLAEDCERRQAGWAVIVKDPEIQTTYVVGPFESLTDALDYRDGCEYIAGPDTCQVHPIEKPVVLL